MTPALVSLIIFCIQTGLPLIVAFGKWLAKIIEKLIHKKITAEILAHGGVAYADAEGVFRRSIYDALIAKLGGRAKTEVLAEALKMSYADFEMELYREIDAGIEKQRQNIAK